jgi:putative ABC transport system permease protein
MNFLLRIWAIFFLAARRLVARRWLALATALGLVVSIALIMSIPLYSDAVYYRILHEELAKTNEGQSLINRPAFAFMYRYLGSIYGTKKFSDAEAVDAYLSGPAVDQLGIPVSSLTRYLKSDTLRMFPAGDVVNSAFASTEDPLEWVSFGAATNFENHVNFVAGAMPAPASANPDEPVEVAIAQVMADKFGIQPGEEYMLFRTTKAETGSRTVQIPVRVSGIWTVMDAMDEYWFYAPTSFDTQLIIPEASFRGRIASLFEDEFDTFMWYWIADGSGVNVSNADRLVSRIDQIRQRAATLLPNTKLEISPYDALRDYQQSSGLLNLLLYAFSIPIVSLLIAFIGLVVGLSVARQRNEIAVMRSRGATALQIISIALVEAMILVAVALAIGAPVSTWLAYTIGATKSFLNFTLEPDLRVQLTSTALGFGLAAGLATLLAQVLPSLGASRHTIISYKQELARTIRPPWWQRAWLDVLLLIPVGYGIYLLRQQGSLVTPGAPVPTDMFDTRCSSCCRR